MSSAQSLVEALIPFTAARTGSLSRTAIAAALEANPTLEATWTVISVLSRGMPTEAELRTAHRTLMAQGAIALIDTLVPRIARSTTRVELVVGGTIVDVRHTAETDLGTGIQRVARETVRRWDRDHDIVLVTWTDDGRAMRRLMPAEYATAIHAAKPVHGSTAAADKTIIVPVGGTYILPELAAEVWRTERVAVMAEHGGLVTGVIGFDTVPLTSAETVGDGMPGAFARNLAAVARMDRVGAISEAAAEEYRGWRRMLAASGLSGPDVASVLLAAEPGSSTQADADEFAELVGVADAPLVVVIGSHEPRKNHLAVLQAAELAWREGLEFHLAFVGGNAWNSLNFTDTLVTMQDAGRPVVSVSALPDRLVWAAYRRARFTVFTSLNEGFGLPVAESLGSGTPVITSNYGSMKQIADAGGAIVVNPRDDLSLLEGLRTMLTDEVRYRELVREAAEYAVRPWDLYAAELWDYFTA